MPLPAEQTPTARERGILCGVKEAAAVAIIRKGKIVFEGDVAHAAEPATPGGAYRYAEDAILGAGALAISSRGTASGAATSFV